MNKIIFLISIFVFACSSGPIAVESKQPGEEFDLDGSKCKIYRVSTNNDGNFKIVNCKGSSTVSEKHFVPGPTPKIPGHNIEVITVNSDNIPPATSVVVPVKPIESIQQNQAISKPNVQLTNCKFVDKNNVRCEVVK